MLAEDPVLLKELSEEQEDFLQAAEHRALADIDPNVAPAPQAAGTNGQQVCQRPRATRGRAARFEEDDDGQQGGASAGVRRFRWCRVGVENIGDTRGALYNRIFVARYAEPAVTAGPLPRLVAESLMVSQSGGLCAGQGCSQRCMGVV
jgi:hypothetical protein